MQGKPRSNKNTGFWTYKGPPQRVYESHSLASFRSGAAAERSLAFVRRRGAAGHSDCDVTGEEASCLFALGQGFACFFAPDHSIGLQLSKVCLATARLCENTTARRSSCNPCIPTSPSSDQPVKPPSR